MIATCANCQNEFEVVMTSRKTAVRGLREYGFACVACDAWTRTHYENRELCRLRQRVQEAMRHNRQMRTEESWERFKERQTEYRQAFDALQAEMS